MNVSRKKNKLRPTSCFPKCQSAIRSHCPLPLTPRSSIILFSNPHFPGRGSYHISTPSLLQPSQGFFFLYSSEACELFIGVQPIPCAQFPAIYSTRTFHRRTNSPLTQFPAVQFPSATISLGVRSPPGPLDRPFYGSMTAVGSHTL